MKGNTRGYWKLLMTYLKPQWRQVLLLGILILISIGLQLVNPQIIRYFIDTAQTGKPLQILLTAAGLFIGVAVVQQVVAVWATYVGQNVGWTSTNALRTDLVAHCLKLDMTFHKEHRSGEIIERIDGDVTQMFNFFSNLLVEVVSHLLLIIGVLVLLYRENGYLGLAMTFFAVFAIFVLNRMQSFTVPRFAAVRDVTTRFYGLMGEVLGNTEDLRANGAVAKIMHKFQQILREWLPKDVIAAFASISMWTSTLTIFAVGNSLAFGVGGMLWSKGLITVGTVYLIFHYTEMLSMPLRQIQRQLVDLQKAGASIQRVEELFAIQSQLVDEGQMVLPEGPLSVEIERVEFAYESGVPVLKELSFNLNAGQVLGVLGRTGSGKTTLARLLTRFYDPGAGNIRFSGQEIQNLPLKELRRQIAYVTQDVQLFNASIRDNLTFFNPKISDQQIWSALGEMGLEEWIRSLPDGLDTTLASDGGGLSAGEAQLLAFVRVFLKDPDLVILDEASSRLDPKTEQLMEKAIDHLFRERTGIIIAHRLQTVERASEILILEDGQILEFGDRIQLSNDPNSYFSGLLQQGIEEVLA